MVHTPSAYITAHEAAFIADVTTKDVHRAIDEHILPDDLLLQGEQNRRLSKWGAVFISVYFKTENVLAAPFRKAVVRSLADQFKGDQLFIFHLQPNAWERVRHFSPSGLTPQNLVVLDLSTHFELAFRKECEVTKALKQVTTSPDVMSGVPVFAGTRVPIDTVLASLDADVDMERLQRSYPFLTEELVQSARVYSRVRPQRGRPRRVGQSNPSWKLKDSKVVRPASE